MTWCLGPIPLHPIGQPWPEDDAYGELRHRMTPGQILDEVADYARRTPRSRWRNFASPQRRRNRLRCKQDLTAA